MKNVCKSSKSRTIVIPVVMSNLFTVLILSSMALPIQLANASSDTSYGQGYNAGRNDALDGRPYNDYCPPNNPDLRCAIYKGAYAVGYAAADVLHGNEVPRNDQDFSDRTDNDNDNNNDNDNDNDNNNDNDND